jgi:hypothetical protein
LRNGLQANSLGFGHLDVSMNVPADLAEKPRRVKLVR